MTNSGACVWPVPNTTCVRPAHKPQAVQATAAVRRSAQSNVLQSTTGTTGVAIEVEGVSIKGVWTKGAWTKEEVTAATEITGGACSTTGAGWITELVSEGGVRATQIGSSSACRYAWLDINGGNNGVNGFAKCRYWEVMVETIRDETQIR